MSEAPPFWWLKPDWRARALWPASFVYGRVAARRLARARREPVGVPVLCVGNFTVGGSGKTPVTIALAREAAAMGLAPGILSRGHGGSLAGAHVVDLRHDTARHVGDEPLLLAEHAPVAVAANRAAGAKLLTEQGCRFLLMDDGFQSARIRIDYALLVIDARHGLGNGHVIPGGPLRAPLVDQLRYTDAVLRMGEGEAAESVVRWAARAGRAIFDARATPRDGARFAGRRVLAFAGIGHPDKFFATLEAAGASVVARRAFADHHAYADDELQDLMRVAEAGGLALVTTGKDAVRLKHGSAAARTLLERLEVLEIDAAFEPPSTPGRIIRETLEAFRRKEGG